MRRTVFTVVGVIIVAVSLAGFVPSYWAASQLASEDGWVELSNTVADDRAVHRAAADTIAQNSVGSGNPLLETIRDLVADTLDQVLDRASSSPGFFDAWEESQRESHRLALDSVEIPDQLVWELSPLADFGIDAVLGDIGGDLFGLSGNVSAPGSLPVVVVEEDARAVLQVVSWSPAVAVGSFVLAALAAVFAVITAPRRASALMGIGVVVAAVAGVWAVFASSFVDALFGPAPDADSLGIEFSRAMSGPLTDAMYSQTVWVAIVGAAIALAGVFVRVIARSPRG